MLLELIIEFFTFDVVYSEFYGLDKFLFDVQNVLSPQNFIMT